MKAVIFDMDGLLIDSEPLWRRAEIEVFESVGLRLTEEDCEQTTGLRTDEIVGYWYDRRPWAGPPPDTVVSDIDSRAAELITEHGAPLPGAVEAVRRVQDAGHPTALASSSSVFIIETVLGTLGIEDLFPIVCSGSDEVLGKPDPAIYRTASRRLELPPSQCVAVEDSIAGVRAALGAGMAVIAVPAPHRFNHPGFDRAHLKLPSLEGFSIDMLHQL
jgi:sugar-phosphatase